jgi:ferrochelatase
MATSPGPAPYDGFLLVSFGGPEKAEDVVPFLRNVTAGKDIPDERLKEVGEHYYQFGGRSPINDQNRELLAAIAEDFASNGVDIPVYWGNRNWDPYLADTLAKMKADGVTRAACLFTAAYSSYSGCRQYRENLADAVAAVPGAPELDRLRLYFNHPGFVEPFVDATLAALAALPSDARHDAHLVFVTHSIPIEMNERSGPLGDAYVQQHRSVVDEVVERVREETGHRYRSALVYCSRSGPPQVPWLEPDVNDHLRELAAREVPGAVIVPIGFVSDHMEVIYDLDTEAMETAAEVGLPCERAATPGVDPRFVAMVRDLLLERAAVERGEDVARATVGSLPPVWDSCSAGCCANPRGYRPAICGADCPWPAPTGWLPSSPTSRSASPGRRVRWWPRGAQRECRSR